jgi:beta-lactamase regulating signal transducer with metallopeptidase domain
MDAAPTYDFWWRLAAILSAEVAAMAAAAWALEKFSSSGAWRRTIWHVCLIGLVTLVAAETSGVGRIVAARFAVPPQPVEATFQSSEIFLFPAEPAGAPEEPMVFFTSPGSNATVAPRQSWWPAILWLTGFAVFGLGAFFLRTLFVIASRCRCQPASYEVLERARQVAALLGLHRRCDVVEIRGISAPVAFGIVKPKIGVPAEFNQKFAAQQQEVMLAHELAHVAGRDAVWHLFADFVTALLWWHPIVWWVRRRLHFATEAAADEASLVVQDGPSVLAETLVALGGGLLRQHRGALGIKGLRSGLACRVRKLMALNSDERRQPSSSHWALKFCGPVLLVAGIIASFAWAGSSRGTPQDEWQNSLVGRTFMALRAAADNTDNERLPGLLGEAKIFFDAGKLDHAEGLCDEVLKIDPENSEALRLLDEIVNARKALVIDRLASPERSQPREMERVLPPDAGGSKDRFVASQTIGSFEHVMSNAVASLLEERKRKAGLMSRERSTSTTNVVYSGKGKQRIRRLLEEIHLPYVRFENVRLAEVLSRLRDEIKELDPEKRGFDLLVSSEVPPAPIDPATGLLVATDRLPVGPGENLLRVENRTIRIDPPLRNVTLGMALDAICKVAESPLCYSVEEYAVVLLPTDRPRALYTRTYRPDPDAVLMHFGRQWPPDRTPSPQPRERDVIHALREFLAEAGVDLAPPKAIFFNDRLGVLMVRATLEDLDVIQQALGKFAAPVRQILLEVKVAEFRGDAVGTRSAFGIELNDKMILVDPQYRMVIRALEGRDHVDVLGPQRAVALNGHQSRFQLPTVETLGMDEAVMRVMTRVGPDDRTVSLDVLIGEREAATAVLRDRQTLMLHLPALKKVYANGVTARIFVRIAFVTVTIIDAAGNRIHADKNEEANPFEGIWSF